MIQEIYLPEIKTEKKEKNRAIFSIEPLSPGYGNTLGNALRRVLLSSLEGTAPVAIRVKGVAHEFSTISGIKEDVVEIMLNVKQIGFKLEGEEKITVKVSKKGPGKVTGADISAPSQVEVINKDQVIATLDSDKAEFSAEIDIEKGRGYQPVEKTGLEEGKINSIDLDALFSPVKKVRYSVETTRLGKVIDLDKLVMDIETDGVVSSDDALRQASDILVDQFSVISGKKETFSKKEGKKEDSPKKKHDAGSIQIEELDLSARAMNAFLANNIETVDQAMEIGASKLSKMKGLGQKAIDELNEKIKEFNLKL